MRRSDDRVCQRCGVRARKDQLLVLELFHKDLVMPVRIRLCNPCSELFEGWRRGAAESFVAQAEVAYRTA